MAAVTSLGITFATASGTETVVATPALGDLIVIVCAYTGLTTVVAPTDNNADGHGTYELGRSAVKNTSADLLSIWVRSDVIQSATSTTFTIAPGATTGGGLQVFKVTGMTIAGPAAIRQSALNINGLATNTPAPSFGGTATLTGNALIGAVFNGTSPATMTPPTGFTESQDVGYSTPTTGLETVFANSGITLSSVTWGSTSASAFSAVLIELDTRIGQTSIFPRGSGALDITLDDSPKLQAVKRAAFF